jgi:hypothetical protein
VAGDVQGPSGTGFDPSPQFWVDRAEIAPGSLAVVGRCFFGPVRTGLVFDGIVSPRNGARSRSDVIACCLRVAEVHVFGRLADEIDQVLSGRLVLSGNAPPGLGYDSLLVSRGSADDGWVLRDGRWTR